MINRKFVFYFRWAILVWLLALVSACNLGSQSPPPIPTSTRTDEGFLSDDPCRAPCFWNITPGVTTRSEAVAAVATISSKGIVDSCNTYDEQDSSESYIECPPNVIINFRPDSEVVSSLGFKPAQKVSVGDVISKYGTPEVVLVTVRGTPEEEPRVVMTLSFNSIGMDLVLEEQNGSVYEVAKSTQIVNVAYSAKDEFTSEQVHLAAYLQTWRGYGIYRVRSP